MELVEGFLVFVVGDGCGCLVGVFERDLVEGFCGSFGGMILAPWCVFFTRLLCRISWKVFEVDLSLWGITLVPLKTVLWKNF